MSLVSSLQSLPNIPDLTHKYTDYLISTTLETVGFALGHSNSRFSPPPPFLLLTLRVIRRSRIGTSVVLVALVYLERIRTRFRISDQRLACERILIGALVLASKVTVVPHPTIRSAI